VRGDARLPGRPGRQARKQAAIETLQHAGASGDLGSGYGEHWWAHRNDAVDTYAKIMAPDRAFGEGVIVDTFEVAGLWSAVPRLYDSIGEALAAHAQAVGCHLSHLYPSGSSLYFTFLISGADDRDAAARYLAAWDQAVRSCAAVGGTITHHGVGRLKAGYLATELGETGVDVGCLPEEFRAHRAVVADVPARREQLVSGQTDPVRGPAAQVVGQHVHRYRPDQVRRQPE
jgi:FAD/FMN-containing dehydrogenase